jgi:hypothetical protein
MLYAGLDLSRKRLDFHLLDGEGATVEVGAAPPDADGLLGLTRRLDRHREPIRAAIESMNGALRARSARARGLAGRDRGCAESEGPRTVGLQDRPHRRLGAGRAYPSRSGCRPSGCPTRWCALSASVRVGVCTWCATAPVSSSACTRSCSRTASPVRSPTSSACAAASCSPDSDCASLAGHDRGQPASDRRTRPRDHWLRARAAPARR